ncbi:Aste57867_8858 [Aphanomyces stellatus]|uniref:Aste57867_8858 protein n=1 Tax=Aphanomyces stellatus TaxID=120398 RepID=A0A485KLA6_9STRA|nr:hypothetical protein As57867_008823 [Aphanomyces stellatus]VFT85744.1 Aste57867_8858 [Aphanomyces stellatus]
MTTDPEHAADVEEGVYEAIQSPIGAPAPPSTPSAQTLRRRVLHIPVVEDAVLGPSFLFPEKDGTHEILQIPSDEVDEIRDAMNKPKHLLGEWVATAICGNDIMSSVLYSAGLVVVKSGKLAPVAFALVSLVLYLYRFIYTEVVMAIPLNGGSYNLLLNTTSKKFASIAACLSTLCYLATGVVSAITACNYFKASVPDFPVMGPAIALLGIFALLMIFGIKESSVAAYGIFLFHMLTLSVLTVVCLIHTIKHPDIIRANYNQPYPSVDYVGHRIDGNFFTALFFGFAAAMLGVTGFETSSNFVEEQKPGVFPKTLRNMWGLSSIYNVTLCILALGVLTIDDIEANQNSVLARMALVAGGEWLQWWVSVDALVVLSGGVLTSYVGITGLMRRLAADRVMPEFLAATNKWRGTTHWIVICFFVLATSLVLILNADPTVLSAVYTYSFLTLMFLFGTGCMMLKLKRRDIPRKVKASWAICTVGVVLVTFGFFGNLLGDPAALVYFAVYFIFVLAIVMLNLERVFALRSLIVFVNLFTKKKIETHGPLVADEGINVDLNPVTCEPKLLRHQSSNLERDGKQVAWLSRAILDISNKPIIFFIKQANLTILNKAILYVRRNEITHNLLIFHIHSDDTPESQETIDTLREMVALMDNLYPKLKIDFYSALAPFDPATVEWISRKFNVTTNMMFIKQPSNANVHKVSAYGVRVITG